MLGKAIDRVLLKHWSDEELDRYMGHVNGAWLTYADSADTRSQAASGGTTSALLIHLLKTGRIDGALVCGIRLANGRVRAHLFVAKSEQEILSARGSKYVETPFVLQALPIIEEFEGKLAVTALPCDITMLKRHLEKHQELAAKIVVLIGIICGHNSRKELIDETTARLEKEAGSPLTDYRFRVGRWRGRLEAEFENGQLIAKSSGHFTTYQNLFYFCERKCLACNDHFGYDADISVGDVWLFRLKDDPIKRTGVLSRTEHGKALLEELFDSGCVHAEPIDRRDIMDGQSRIGPYHYNVTARARFGRLLGINLKSESNVKVKWHELFAAMITMINVKISESERGRRWIFALPRVFHRLYLYVLKGLESLK